MQTDDKYYRLLLKKYIKYVRSREGTDFILDCDEFYQWSDVEGSAQEWDELTAIAECKNG